MKYYSSANRIQDCLDKQSWKLSGFFQFQKVKNQVSHKLSIDFSPSEAPLPSSLQNWKEISQLS